MAICNMDCFSCQYDDCINDEITYKDFQEEENRDKALRVVHKGGDAERRRVYQRDYYSKNRVTELEKRKPIIRNIKKIGKHINVSTTERIKKKLQKNISQELRKKKKNSLCGGESTTEIEGKN